MPRDDLSIDFVHRMAPSVEAQDPGLILDDWIHRTSNLHEEIRFLQDEIHDKDRAYNECIKSIEESDGKIQRWIRANSSAQPNPREDLLRGIIRENYSKADQLSAEKIALSTKLSLLLDKHLRHLDGQIKLLYDRGEPGFTDPDEVPSVLRPSAANHSIPSTRFPSTAAAQPLNPIVNNATPSGARPSNPQIRTTQVHAHTSSSAPTTPAASMILNRKERESSAGPGSGAPKRGPRTNSGLGSQPAASSGLARHSSIGPGTPKAGTPGSTGRAGSAGPRATTKVAGVRKGTPSGVAGRKKPPNAKSGLNRVKQAGRSKGSPTSTADSELSEAESAPSSRAASRAGSLTPAPASAATSHLPNKRPHKHEDGDEDMADHSDDNASGSDEEDEEGKKYCLCQHVSYGDMVACDNPDCPYEWFHWNCVGLKSEPQGRWFCPDCAESLRKKGK
ncbi:PHD-finger domain-containing protein [Xylariales sp. AK1849]|nr:PHD-finger domain-containing protein [Xylariales sp. AK1849]